MSEKSADTSVILVCAGNASRMGGVNKILMPLNSSTVIGVCLSKFQECPDVAEIIIVTKQENFQPIQEIAENLNITKLSHITEGGDTRQKSVMQGLKLVSKDSAYIAVHDGARPLVKTEHISKVIQDARVFGGATLGVPVKDTIKTVDDGLITDTPPRASLWITQTPQVFKKRLYFEAVDFALEHNLDFTDDCQLVEAVGGKICMTRGDYTNIKITTPEDIQIAEVLA